MKKAMGDRSNFFSLKSERGTGQISNVHYFRPRKLGEIPRLPIGGKRQKPFFGQGLAFEFYAICEPRDLTCPSFTPQRDATARVPPGSPRGP